MFDAVRFCNDYGISWISKGKNVGRGWIGINDPFSFDDGFHAGFHLSDGHFYSWRTGGASLFRVVKALTQKSDFEVFRIIDEYSEQTTLRKNLQVKKAQALQLTLPGDPLDEMCRNYLRKRRFDPDYIEKKYGVRSGGITGEWAFRLIIPVVYNGALVTYVGRDITGKLDIRYRNLPIEKSVVNLKDILYNLDNCTKESILVVEGSTDVWRFGDNCAATMGTMYTEAQIRLLSKYTKVHIMFDSEEAAQKRAVKLAESIASLGTDVEVLDHGLDHDMGAMTEDEIDYIRKEINL